VGIFDKIKEEAGKAVSTVVSPIASNAGGLQDAWDSASGKTSKQHAQNTAAREAAAVQAQKEKSEALAGEVGEKRSELEGVRIGEAPTMTAERIAREGVQNVTGGPADASQQAQFRGEQMSLAQRLAAQSRGEGPSVAGMQLKQATDRNLAQQLAMQAGASGAQAAAARRQSASQVGDLGQQAAGQSAILRLQEQQAAQQQLAGVTAAGRQADIGLATADADRDLRANLANQGVDLDVLKANAAAGNAAAQANLSAELSKMGMDDAMIQSYLAAETGLLTGQQQALMQQQQTAATARASEAAQKSSVLGGLMSAGGALGGAAIMASDENVKKNIKNLSEENKVEAQATKNKKSLAEALKGLGKAGQTKDLGSGIASAGDSIAKAMMSKANDSKATSDEDVKEGVKPAGNKLDEVMDNLSASEYEYIDDKYGDAGKHVSVMAQDLQKSEIGSRAVSKAEDGSLRVDYAKLLPAILAESVQNRKKVTKLEEALARRKNAK
jgi:hypothetical protein